MMNPKPPQKIATKKKKLPTIRILRDRLDYTFNEYIRKRDGKCILCGSIERLVCSHYYGKKARPIIRWNEMNATAMCSSCHWKHHHGIEGDYALFMFKKFGMEKMELLKTDSLVVEDLNKEWSREWLNEKIDEFKLKLKQVEGNTDA